MQENEHVFKVGNFSVNYVPNCGRYEIWLYNSPIFEICPLKEADDFRLEDMIEEIQTCAEKIVSDMESRSMVITVEPNEDKTLEINRINRSEIAQLTIRADQLDGLITQLQDLNHKYKTGVRPLK